MNERIKGIEQQCWEVRQYNPPWFNATKFAELIVKECINLCEDEWNGDADTFLASEAYNECAEAIKEHFGVEE